MVDSPTEKVTIEKKYCPKCYGQFEGPVEECPECRVGLCGASNDPRIGKVFAERYEIESVLGLGGMSIVYKGKHKLMDRVVAIKMLHSQLKDDIIALERFRLEAQAASLLDHQNIITVYDFGVTDSGEPYFVMDCLEGESLKDLIDRKGKVPWQRALPIFRQICDGLDAAHLKKVVHRDMKPANVVLMKREDGSELVKLVDFGIAKLLPGAGKQSQQLTKTGEVFGSPIYMSPEQCMGRELDQRSDIYAVACLMYETLAGVPPFLGESFLQTMNMHVSEKAKHIKQVAPDADVPQQLENLIFKCMSKEPSERPQSAGEIRDTVAALTMELLGHSGVQSGFASGSRSTTTMIVTPACKNRFRAMQVVSVVASVVAAGLVGMMCFYPGPAEDRGTPLNKMMWMFAMSDITSAIKGGDFPRAEASAHRAEDLARNFGDGKDRLVKTLTAETQLYDKWEGHSVQLEKVNAALNGIQVQALQQEVAERMRILDELNKTSGSAVAEANTKLKAAAQSDGILVTIGKLFGRSMYPECEKLLTKAVAVESKLLGDDSIAVAPLKSKLADTLQQLRKYTGIRTLLLSVVSTRKKDEVANPSEYVHALNKLGQFDLDQNNFKDAEPELVSAVDQAKKLDGHKDLLAICLRSYADYLRQVHKDDESKKVLKEADSIDTHGITSSPTKG